ncbi:MAG: TonB-dependent receptor [Bacteroidales bacterium]|nr:TonB-dependent receptor [Bacteroidales bacterium]
MNTIKKLIKNIIALWAILIFPAYISSANNQILFQVKGTVIDSISGEGISYVTISIQNIDGVIKRLAANESGKFSFELTEPGEYDVIFHSIGYQLQKREIKINEASPAVDLGTVYMHQSVEEIGEVVVAVQKPLIRTEPDKIVYSLEADPESKTSNVLEILRKVPLITIDGEDNIQLKGSSNFKILIDGKSSSMVSQSPGEILRSLPANTIRDIEVITDPSSKYEAEGTAGIINIITNKKPLEGFMSRISSGIDTRGGYNAGLFATSKIKKFGFSLNYGNNKFKQPANELYSSRENLLSTTNYLTVTEGRNKYTGSGNFLRGEASYEIDTLNLISLSFWGYFGNANGTGLNLTGDYNLENALTRQFENSMDFINEYGSMSGNIDYQRTFKKPDKTFTVSYRLDNSPRNTFNENSINGILDYISYHQKNSNEAFSREHTFQVDYYNPLTKIHQVETGMKYILRQNVSNSDLLRFNEDKGEWEQDLSRINDLDYNQYILGLYVGYVAKLKKINIKTGLRAESTKNDGLFKSAADTMFTNRLFNIIPYITLSKNLKKNQNVKLSYTQRLSRPGIWHLNPFYNDIDPLNVRYGNPKLNSEITHSFNFSYGKFTPEYNFNLNLSSSFTNNSITSYTKLQPDGVSITTYENIGKNQNFGAYVYGSVKVGKAVNLNTNLGINYVEMERGGDMGIKNEGFSYNGSLSARITTWTNGIFSLFGGVYSPSVILQGKYSGFSYSSMSISQSFFNKKLTINASVSDPFRQKMTHTSNLADKTFTSKSTNYIYNRMFRIYISYQFGQMKEQIKKARRTISNEDLKSGGDSGQGGTTTVPEQ